MAPMKQRPGGGVAYCALCALATFAIPAAARDAPAPQVHPQLWPRLPPAIAPDPQLEARIDALLERMTPEQKVGQLIQADIGSITPEDLRHFPLGSVLNGGNSSPFSDKLAAPSVWLKLADGFYQASMEGPPAAAIPV